MHLPFATFVCETEPTPEIRHRLTFGERLQVITLNPEMIVKAWREPWFAALIETADITTIDGAGLAITLSLLHKKRIQRTTGVDLLEKVTNLLPHQELPISLLGGESVAREQIQTRLQTAGLNVISLGLPQIPSLPGRAPDLSIIDWPLLERTLQGIVFIALSFGTQEEVAKQVLARCPNVRMVIGVGGAFNTLSGRLKRAPAWCRAIGCEWMWRLILEPKRFHRIFTATVVFPLLTLRHLLREKKMEFYRH